MELTIKQLSLGAIDWHAYEGETEVALLHWTKGWVGVKAEAELSIGDKKLRLIHDGWFRRTYSFFDMTTGNKVGNFKTVLVGNQGTLQINNQSYILKKGLFNFSRWDILDSTSQSIVQYNIEKLMTFRTAYIAKVIGDSFIDKTLLIMLGFYIMINIEPAK